jgi:hypothetical protein
MFAKFLIEQSLFTILKQFLNLQSFAEKNLANIENYSIALAPCRGLMCKLTPKNRIRRVNLINLFFE